MRARIVLKLAGIRCELREVVLRDKPTEMLKVSPKGTVPVLVLPGGRVIDESIDIVLWAIEQSMVDTLTVRLSPFNLDDLSLIEKNDGPFKGHLDRYKYPNRYEHIDRLEQRAGCEQFLDLLNLRLADQSWLAGEQASALDACIGPFIRQCANTDRTWFDGCAYTHVQRWLAAFLEWAPFTAIMAKYPQWKPGDPRVMFPPGS